MSEDNDTIARLVHDHFAHEVAAVRRRGDASADRAAMRAPAPAADASHNLPGTVIGSSRPEAVHSRLNRRRMLGAAAAALLLALPALMPVCAGSLRPLAARIDAAWSEAGRAIVVRALEEAHEIITLQTSEQEE